MMIGGLKSKSNSRLNTGGLSDGKEIPSYGSEEDEFTLDSVEA